MNKEDIKSGKYKIYKIRKEFSTFINLKEKTITTEEGETLLAESMKDLLTKEISYYLSRPISVKNKKSNPYQNVINLRNFFEKCEDKELVFSLEGEQIEGDIPQSKK